MTHVTPENGAQDHCAPTGIHNGRDDKADEHAEPHQIPSSRGSATFTAGPGGAPWVSVEGADIQELSNNISAICGVLNVSATRSQGRSIA